MYIGDIIKEYRSQHNLSLEEFANAANLTIPELTALEANFEKDSTTPITVAMRQLRGIAQAMNIAMPILMSQLPSDQEVAVNVIADSDQPHMK